MNVLDIFSGIGGFSLGLERAGMRTVAFCEIEPYARAVLAKHWPHVRCYTDVRELTAERLHADGISVDVICGGFPCQDLSVAGKGAGLSGERSGLWFEYARIIGEVRPSYVIVENVAVLLSRGLDVVLGDLAALGFNAEWHCIPASAIGAPHERDRIWIVANASCGRLGKSDCRKVEQPRRAKAIRASKAMADSYDGEQSPGRTHGRMGRLQIASEIADDGYARRANWRFEPGVGRVANGIPNRVDRVAGLGNAVVPQIPEIIGRAIMSKFSHHSQEGHDG